jgi:hypothetical protein
MVIRYWAWPGANVMGGQGNLWMVCMHAVTWVQSSSGGCTSGLLLGLCSACSGTCQMLLYPFHDFGTLMGLSFLLRRCTTLHRTQTMRATWCS